ncbi:MAG: hypothetical protein II837_03435 [Treponema sp.]|nr:hypothetical protein [Treponema sp.]MBQ6565790.1 hypothetical protein [Treponema sp.]MBQ7167084.1 hypothetical protein [Treponema sp.]
MDDSFKFNFADNNDRKVISEGKGGWRLELNLVSWGDRPAKYDIRSWSPDHQKMGKGVTMTAEELKSLKSILDGMTL